MKQQTRSADIAVEFDRLRNDYILEADKNASKFLEEARTSLESPQRLKRRDTFKRSLLHYAAMGNCTHLLLYLLQHKLNIDSRDMHGRTPLSWAAEHGSLAAAEILLDHGADINAMDYENGTPLSYLVYAGNPEKGNLKATEAFLRERGAKLNGSRNAFKRAWVWILTYSRLLSCVRPNV
ncbi:hypothetical protein AKAW_11324 [Aspergillus luchuensis IFO 4308]|nr:hypothetical protein AKAW_11324 [Aspergillus luchuensis IFO 4308]